MPSGRGPRSAVVYAAFAAGTSAAIQRRVMDLCCSCGGAASLLLAARRLASVVERCTCAGGTLRRLDCCTICTFVVVHSQRTEDGARAGSSFSLRLPAPPPRVCGRLSALHRWSTTTSVLHASG